MISEEVTVKRQTDIEYLPKENNELTDVELLSQSQNVHVKVNDKTYTFKKLDSENHKFDDGKVKVTQTSELDINIKVPTIHQKWRVGAFSNYTSSNKIDAGLRLNRQFKGWDLDMTINKDKKMTGGVTIWF